MNWRVIREFVDSLDNYHLYKAGDLFPRLGKEVSAQRIEELSTSKNGLGAPLIEAVFEKEANKTARKSTRKKGDS